MIENRVTRLPAGWQPGPSAKKGLEEIAVVRTRPALPEFEDVNACQDEGERADGEAEYR